MFIPISHKRYVIFLYLSTVGDNWSL